MRLGDTSVLLGRPDLPIKMSKLSIIVLGCFLFFQKTHGQIINNNQANGGGLKQDPVESSSAGLRIDGLYQVIDLFGSAAKRDQGKPPATPSRHPSGPSSIGDMPPDPGTEMDKTDAQMMREYGAVPPAGIAKPQMMSVQAVNARAAGVSEQDIRGGQAITPRWFFPYWRRYRWCLKYWWTPRCWCFWNWLYYCWGHFPWSMWCWWLWFCAFW